MTPAISRANCDGFAPERFRSKYFPLHGSTMPEFARVIAMLRRDYVPFVAGDFTEEERDLIRLGCRPMPEAGRSIESELLSRIQGMWPADQVLLFNYGRSALQYALRLLKSSDKDEVLLPSYSCRCLHQAIIQAGLQPVAYDSGPDFNPSLIGIMAQASSRSLAVIVPHLFGKWADDIEAITQWARERQVVAIEDAAQAAGLNRNGRAAGTLTEVAIFSSGIGKPTFAITGGWLLLRGSRFREVHSSGAQFSTLSASQWSGTQDLGGEFACESSARGRRHLLAAMKRRILALRPGSSESLPRFDVLPMDRIAARLLCRQLGQIDRIVTRQLEFGRRWTELLRHKIGNGFRWIDGADHIFTKCLLFASDERERALLRRFRNHLERHGIETELSYRPLHLRSDVTVVCRSKLPVVEQIWEGAFSVVTRASLSEEEWSRIQQVVDRF